MNNKTNIEEDIKILEDYSYALATISSATEKDIRLSKAIENILEDRERLEKENEKLNTEIAKHVYFENIQMKELNAENNRCAMFAIKNNELEKSNVKLKTELENKRREYQETYKDTREELKELQVKANKYDSLVEKIKRKIEIHKDYLFNLSNTNNLALDAHFREKERYAISILQELLDTKKEN